MVRPGRCITPPRGNTNGRSLQSPYLGQLLPRKRPFRRRSRRVSQVCYCLRKRLSNIKLWQIILSSITTAGFIAAIFGAGPIGAVIGVLVSTTLLVLNTYTKNYDLGELAQKHRQASADLWFIREKYLALITDLHAGEESLENAMNRRDALLENLHGVYSEAPSTNYQAYKKAQKALQQCEEMTFSDAEIDALLPSELRGGGA